MLRLRRVPAIQPRAVARRRCRRRRARAGRRGVRELVDGSPAGAALLAALTPHPQESRQPPLMRHQRPDAPVAAGTTVAERLVALARRAALASGDERGLRWRVALRRDPSSQPAPLAIGARGGVGGKGEAQVGRARLEDDHVGGAHALLQLPRARRRGGAAIAAAAAVAVTQHAAEAAADSRVAHAHLCRAEAHGAFLALIAVTAALLEEGAPEVRGVGMLRPRPHARPRRQRRVDLRKAALQVDRRRRANEQQLLAGEAPRQLRLVVPMEAAARARHGHVVEALPKPRREALLVARVEDASRRVARAPAAARVGAARWHRCVGQLVCGRHR